MILPVGVSAFLLFNAANMSEENEKLARATIDELYYDNMKDKVLKIFVDPASCEDSSGALAVKLNLHLQ